MRPFLLLVLAWALSGLPSAARAQDPLIARFSTVAGDFDVLLNAQAAPITVSNFVRYAGGGLYDGTFLHRSTTYNPADIQIIQGGSYGFASSAIVDIPLFSPIPLEANLPNLRGTIAMARQTAPDTATSGWFFNFQDDTRLDASGHGTGYAVFGRVLGNGMVNVVDPLGSVPSYNATNALGPAFGQLPLLQPNLNLSSFLHVFNVDAITFRVTSARREPGGFRVEWTPLSTNTPVNVERRTSLASDSWTVVSSNNTNASFLDASAPAGGAFYRVVVP